MSVAQPDDLGGLEPDLPQPIIDQDKIVTRPVHFGKDNSHPNRVAISAARFQVESGPAKRRVRGRGAG